MGPETGRDAGRDKADVSRRVERDAGRERSTRKNGASGTERRTRLSVAELRQLISLMNASDIEEITLEHETGGLRLTLRKPAPVVIPPEAPALPSPVGMEAEEPEEAAEDAAPEEPARPLVEVRAPLVGIFRSSMKEHGKSLVHEDDTVRQGQVVAAIEALNVYNEVEVPAAGRVKTVLVADGQRVEYGQPLLLIEPKSTF